MTGGLGDKGDRLLSRAGKYKCSKVLRNDVFTVDTSNLYVPPLLGFAVIAFGIALAYLVARVLPIFFTGLDTPAKKGTFAACAGMLNYR